ncbi:OLC1v1036800C1 [Oldenlandia corymbosa var. corymbosa]|uniref:OLC1v1036800C1 n=1 Tax=Oldenlandia corymbosa var. corymbosa TaxID=529605 RepID=A0AAV1CXC4_OLDCO|nr:OLC1v1036800C1 [Oldenlandia corymbosa var. corymbosa]
MAANVILLWQLLSGGGALYPFVKLWKPGIVVSLFERIMRRDFIFSANQQMNRDGRMSNYNKKPILLVEKAFPPEAKLMRRRNSKTAQKAVIKAQKEAEKKLKDREKRAKKKAGLSGDVPEDEEQTEAVTMMLVMQRRQKKQLYSSTIKETKK